MHNNLDNENVKYLFFQNIIILEFNKIINKVKNMWTHDLIKLLRKWKKINFLL